MTYCQWQTEKCPTSGRIHQQGWIRFENAVNSVPPYKNLQKALGTKGAHFELIRGSAQENMDYCAKRESRVAGPWDWGSPPSPGERNDIKKLYEYLKEGDIEGADENCPMEMIKYHRGAEAFASRAAARRVPWKREVKTIVITGPAGAGKTHMVYETYTESITYVKDPNSRWWDGYQGQPVVFIEDFKGGIQIGMLLSWMEGYKKPAEVKGGTCVPAHTILVITSVMHPDFWYGKHEPEIMRRITTHIVLPPRITQHTEVAGNTRAATINQQWPSTTDHP